MTKSGFPVNYLLFSEEVFFPREFQLTNQKRIYK